MMKLRTPARRRSAQRYRSGMGPRLYESGSGSWKRALFVSAAILTVPLWAMAVAAVAKRVLGW